MDAVFLILTKYGLFGVMIAAFFEAILFPPPVEIILLPVMIANRDRAVLYAIITVIVSMFGASVGYRIGKSAGRALIVKLFSENKVERIKKIYDKYGALAIVTSAFTPIPYEAYTLSAGVFKMNFPKFIGAAFAGRVIRYVPEGIIIQLFGHAIKSKTITNISIFVTSSILLITVYILVKKIFMQEKEFK